MVEAAKKKSKKKHHKKHHKKVEDDDEEIDAQLIQLENVDKSASIAKRKELDDKKKHSSIIAQIGSTLSGTMHYILGAKHEDN